MPISDIQTHTAGVIIGSIIDLCAKDQIFDQIPLESRFQAMIK